MTSPLEDPRFIAFLIGHGIRDASQLTFGDLKRLYELYERGDRTQ